MSTVGANSSLCFRTKERSLKRPKRNSIMTLITKGRCASNSRTNLSDWKISSAGRMSRFQNLSSSLITFYIRIRTSVYRMTESKANLSGCKKFTVAKFDNWNNSWPWNREILRTPPINITLSSKSSKRKDRIMSNNSLSNSIEK